MKMKTQTMKPMVEMITIFDKHLDALLPENKPTKEKVAAARATATIGNSRLSHLKLVLENARLQGKKPDMPMLELPAS